MLNTNTFGTIQALELVAASPFAYPNYSVLIHPRNVGKQDH